MSMQDMWAELALENNNDSGVINTIVRKAPVIATVPMSATNNGDHDVYEVVVDIDRIPKSELDAPLQLVNAESKLEQVGISHFSARQDVGVGKLKKLKKSAPQYFAEKADKIFGRTAQDMETTLIYEDIQATALSNNNTAGTDFYQNRVHDAGGTNNTNSSIQIVTWEKGETEGLYDPNGFGNGKMFDVTQVGAGTRLDADNVELYTYAYRMDMGVKLANPRYVTSIVNIDVNADLTSSGINLPYYLSLMLERAWAEDGGTLIYMPNELRVKLSNEVNFEKMQFTSPNRAIDTNVFTWDSIPIITSRNMYNGTEANKTVA